MNRVNHKVTDVKHAPAETQCLGVHRVRPPLRSSRHALDVLAGSSEISSADVDEGAPCSLDFNERCETTR